MAETKEIKEEKNKVANVKDYDKSLIIIPVLLVAITVIWLLVDPEALTALSSVATVFVDKTTWIFLIIPLVLLVVLIWWACTPNGNIRMGGPLAQPKYSFYSYATMLWCAGFGSATVVLSFLEWAVYSQAPPFNTAPMSLDAFYYSLPYSFFNWGITTCALNLFLAIPFCYSFYVRGYDVLRLGEIFAYMSGKKISSGLIRFLNFIFIFCIMGGMTCTLGFGVPKMSACLVDLFGFTNANVVNIVILVLCSAVFTVSASVGIKRGIQNLTRINMILLYAFLAIAVIVGPTTFIFDNIVTSFGVMIDQFFTMALNADPIYGSKFAQHNTVFYYCYSWAYVAMMAGFLTVISYGRTFREMIFSCVICIPAGVWLMFGINSSTAMYNQINGIVDVGAILNESGSTAAAIAVVKHMGLGDVLGVAVFGLMILIFIGSGMDGTAVVLANTTMKSAEQNNEPSVKMKLIWCLILAAIPLLVDALGGELWHFEAIVNLTGWPIMVVGIFMWVFLFKWLKQDKAKAQALGLKNIAEITDTKKELA
jgi:BCCT family betaine/carnitine transporter